MEITRSSYFYYYRRIWRNRKCHSWPSRQDAGPRNSISSDKHVLKSWSWEGNRAVFIGGNGYLPSDAFEWLVGSSMCCLILQSFLKTGKDDEMITTQVKIRKYSKFITAIPVWVSTLWSHTHSWNPKSNQYKWIPFYLLYSSKLHGGICFVLFTYTRTYRLSTSHEKNYVPKGMQEYRRLYEDPISVRAWK